MYIQVLLRSLLGSVAFIMRLLSTVLVILVVFLLPSLLISISSEYQANFGQLLLIATMCILLTYCSVVIILKISNFIDNL